MLIKESLLVTFLIHLMVQKLNFIIGFRFLQFGQMKKL